MDAKQHHPSSTLFTPEERHDFHVLEIWKAFRDAKGEDCAYHLSNAGHFLQLGLRNGLVLSEDDRFHILRWLVEAEAAALVELPAVMSRDDVMRGLHAYADQIEIWCETPAERRANAKLRPEVHFRARIFRNACHNAELERFLDANAAKWRRDAVIESLRRVGQTFNPYGNTPSDAAPAGGTPQ